MEMNRTYITNATLDYFQVGQRVQLHPATDRWMMGDRYGEVVKVGKVLVHVKLDKSRKIAKLHPSNVVEII
jgi:hypothetical protein